MFSNISAQTFDEKKVWVREGYEEVQNNLSTYTKKEYYPNSDEQTSAVDYYYLV